MSKDHAREALNILDDEANRTAIVAGDLSCLDGVDLTDEELDMVKAAAADDYPEVAGFAYDAFLGGVAVGGLAGHKDPAANEKFLKLDGLGSASQKLIKFWSV